MRPLPGSSAIEWTNATWNPVTGCTPVSRGCDHCYARTLAQGRLSRIYRKRLPVLDTPSTRRDPFAVRLWPERLTQPCSWREPRMIFVNSMSDLFHADIPDEFVLKVFEIMLETPRHTYQILTKRPGRAARFFRRFPTLSGSDGLLPDHIWIGTSIEDQDAAHRARHLRSVPARVRFLSCEPLLGPLELSLEGIHWVIAGGESGPGHRPMHTDWVRALRDRCLELGVPFFFKQWGGATPKAGGRTLDQRTWDDFPVITTV
ncbi:MAG: phage Gp37/Gp68 family protein [Gemmatimonadetes bacterium]|nr:MAG: phage Gp37/Gp68 family protein [Gemmatimonadota bacterium]